MENSPKSGNIFYKKENPVQKKLDFNIKACEEAARIFCKKNKKFQIFAHNFKSNFEKYQLKNPGHNVTDFFKALPSGKSEPLNAEKKFKLMYSLEKSGIKDKEADLVAYFYEYFNTEEYIKILNPNDQKFTSDLVIPYAYKNPLYKTLGNATSKLIILMSNLKL